MLGGQWINAGGTETKTYKTAFWRCQCFAPVVSVVVCLISSRCLNQPHHTPNVALPSEGGGIAKRIKTARLRRKTKPGRSAHNCSIILNISHLMRTRSIASLPCKIVWEIWCGYLPRKYFIIMGFSPWNGEWFLSLGQCGRPSLEGDGGILWLAAWKLVSNDAKRKVAPPNAKHSTLLQGCFLCFCFWFHSRFDNNA